MADFQFNSLRESFIRPKCSIPIFSFSYEIKCRVCFRNPFHDTSRSFQMCTMCNLAWWCSQECKEHFGEVHTRKTCASYRTVAAVDAVKITYSRARQSAKAIMLVMDPRTSYIPPSKLSDWADFHKRIFPDFEFAARVTAYEFRGAHPDATRALELLATESTSIPLTLLGALEETIPDLPTRPKLCIHIVGAAGRELQSTGMMEKLLHYLPRLKNLKIVYVGPEVFEGADPLNLACTDCQREGRCRASVRYTTQYHEFSESAAFHMHSPDFIAGFNTGLGEVDVAAWRLSLEAILNSNVPTLFTAYTETEANRDLAVLRSLRASVLKSPEENKWRGVIPEIDEITELCGESGRTRTQYTNHFRFVVRGKAL
ncbi:hypothetical protein B0H13DRAFT_1596902 [Mycena leptocephala]|nr:hypothetical protein B0H13DRAFT_1596902 [Mycena leptocephala]